MKNHLPIICFSNAFGLGPTGNMQHVVRSLRLSWEGPVYAAFSPDVKKNIQADLFDDVYSIDDRSLSDIEKIVQLKDEAIILSFSNRFAIEVAKKLERQSLLFDSLGWMWDTIPEFYHDADSYITYNMPGTQQKIEIMGDSFKRKAHILPFMSRFKNLEKVKKKDTVLVYVGGLQNPFKQDRLVDNYSKVVNIILEEIPQRYSITVTSDTVSLSKLCFHTKNNRIKFTSMAQEDFLEELSSSEYFLTTAGMNATKEALITDTKFSYLPATNWSQYCQQEYFENKTLACGIKWDDLLSKDISYIKNLKEKEAIRSLSEEIELIDFDQVRPMIKNSVYKLFYDLPDVYNNQKEFLKSMKPISEHDFSKKLLDIILKCER